MTIPWRRAACLTVLLALASLPAPAEASTLSALAELRVKPASARILARYDRAKFMTGWRRPGTGGCDTRQIVLMRDDRSPGGGCGSSDGLWFSPYDGRTLTDTGQIDVDHVVPLANAWISGAWRWSPARRHAFAHDLIRPELIAVSESVNLDKGGHSPANWRPPVRAYWCAYARKWIAVKHHYGLSVTWREKSALQDMLATCG
ncbi:HNH endonuclease family protein [Herbidospora cretacea]|uniref:HNH endonuclease family protein n=1 Tax=Herbidospora cretacea TaxID=28444 RepID=UPI0007748587|nr:HNH endonuclease family protein [Herbidospora cretacea]